MLRATARNSSILAQFLTFSVAVAILAPSAGAQTAPGGQQSFEVASIRKAPPNAPYSGNVGLDGSDYLLGYNGGIVKTDGLLISYILFAYNVQDASQYPQIYAQLPKSIQNERYVVEARPTGNPTKDQIRLMMQSLLADRFKLAIHTETHQLPMYALTLDKPGKLGPKLQPHPDDGLCTKAPDKTPPLDKHSLRPSCSLIIFGENPHLPHVRMMDYTMEQIAGGLQTVGVLAGGIDSIPLLDRTGLAGKFDIDLTFLRQPKPGQPPESLPEEPGPSFVEALKTQAGLRLVKQNGPVEVFVLDHVEPPSEN